MQLEKFNVIGISVRTTNQNGQSMQDIPALWARFVAEGIINQIPDKVDNTVYGIYTDYEGDHTMPYTTIIGCKVNSLDNIPDGMMGKEISGGKYEQFTAKGNIAEGAVFNEWVRIWAAGYDRAFTSDIEVYGVKALNPTDAEVDILIAMK